jgi:hypothetical protein
MSEIKTLAEKLKSEGEKFTGIFSDFTETQWQSEVYTEGAVWTVRDVLSHFVTAERDLLRLFEQIRQGGSGVSEDFSIDRFNASQQEKSRGATIPELLEAYRSLREQTVTWVSGMKESDLELTGRHPFLGMTTLREMLKTLYVHNQLHYRDIRKALK